VDLRCRLTVEGVSVDVSVVANTDENHASVGVRECRHGLADRIRSEALLELDLVVLARKELREVVAREDHRRLVGAGEVERRI
jgi:hypothetical protein